MIKKPIAEPAAKKDLQVSEASKKRMAIKTTKTLKPISKTPFNELRNRSRRKVF
jgi:Txe/YoeB family toxin of Txe-Axe toxin-antitoxin module